jgi:hypothetical protein
MAARAWTVLMRVGDGGQRAEVVKQALDDTRPTIRARALVVAGLGGEFTAEQSAAIAARYQESRTAERHATLFSLGMAGAPEMAGFAESEDAETHDAARWWLGQGPAIHDRDLAAG